MRHSTVSIIIPVYNEEKHIASCLDSVQQVNYPGEAIETIVVDNGSTDKTRDIASAHGAKVLCDENLNVSGLRNFGAKKATGKILAFIDADCIVHPDWLIASSRYFDDPHVAAWGSPPVPPENPTWVQKTWYQIRKKNQSVQSVQWLESMNLFMRRPLYQELGGFDEALVTCEDVDLSYRVGKFGDIISDDRINAVHLGEASNIREFIRKEIWRGQGNLKGAFNHGLSLKEIPSLSVPIYFVLLTLAAVALLIHNNSGGAPWVLVALAMLPSIAVLVKKRKKINDFKQLAQLFLLLQIYFFSRTLSLFKKGR